MTFITTGIVAIINLSLGLLTWSRGKKTPVNVVFFTLIVFIVLWTLSNATADYFAEVALNPAASAFYTKITIALGSLIACIFYFFAHLFPRTKLTLKPVATVIVSIATIIVTVLALATTTIVQAVTLHPVEVVTGSLYLLFILQFSLLFLIAFYRLIKKYRQSRGVEKSQIQYLFLGTFTTALFATFTNVILPIINEALRTSRYGPYFTIFLVGFTAYAIIAHQLFDVRVIIKRTVVYSGLLLFAVLVYSMIVFFFATILGEQESFTLRTFIINLLAAGVIAFGFEPIRQFLVKVTDKYLFVGEYDAQAVIATLAQTLSNVLDLDEALQSTMKAVIGALRAQLSATFILHTDKETGTTVKRVQTVGYNGQQIKLPAQSVLVRYFAQQNNEPIVTEELKAKVAHDAGQHPQCQALATELNGLSAGVALPIRASDKLIGILTVGPKLSGDDYSTEDLQFLDIVAKQTAAAIEKSRFYEDDQLKSEFVSIASHELLTPTAAIEGYLSMILDEKMAKVDPKAEEYLRKVQNSAHRLAELVADLLSVSRIEGGRIVINKKPIDVSQIVARTIDEIKVKADQAHITLKYLAPTQPLSKGLADPDRVAQIVTNLISNAIKYNRPNGIVAISLAADQKFLTVTVADNGIGIDKKHIPHLFEKFYRVHDDTAAAEKIGTGLGLFITRSIVELMGGRIGVASEPGKGSTFAFTVPLA